MIGEWIHAILSGSAARDLTAAKKVALAVAGLAALAAPLVIGMMDAPAIVAQSRSAVMPKFDVASIKPCTVNSGDMGRGSKTKGGGGGGNSSPGRLSAGCQTVADLIHQAYVVYASGHAYRQPWGPPISGGPGWIESARYAINATAEGSPSEAMMRGPIMQRLLEDRFKLKIHRESREVPVYALTVAKGGPKLQQFQEGSCIPVDPTNWPPPQPPPGQKNCQAVIMGGSLMRIEAQGTTVDYFSKLLFLVLGQNSPPPRNFALDRPVIDKTGITGLFDFHLEFAPLEAIPNIPPDADPSTLSASGPAGQSIFTAVQRLGLRLELAKGPRDYFVIDSVERPSGN